MRCDVTGQLRPRAHADEGATMKVTLEKLGIVASYSRPRVSNGNPFSEALFCTCKYRPDWPNKGFATNAWAQDLRADLGEILCQLV